MISILESESLRNSVTEELKSSQTVTLLSAYITGLGMNWFLRALPPQAVLVVVGRFLPMDFIRGASDLNAVRMLLEQGHTVKSLSSLHAKIIYIDNKKVFLGSANCTGRGLGLVEHHNLEASVKLEVDEAGHELITGIVHVADEITFDTIEKMESYLSETGYLYDEIKKVSQEWPEEFYQKEEINELYVRDFPLAPLGEYSEVYDVFFESDYSKIYKLKRNKALAKAVFKSSCSYVWLIQLLSKDTNRDGVSFGKISSYLHDVLADDPAPYRRTVKDLQVNLYSYLVEYAGDVVEFYTPGQRSQFIKLRS